MSNRITEFTISVCLDPVRSLQSSFCPNQRGAAGDFVFSDASAAIVRRTLTELTISPHYACIVSALPLLKRAKKLGQANSSLPNGRIREVQKSYRRNLKWMQLFLLVGAESVSVRSPLTIRKQHCALRTRLYWHMHLHHCLDAERLRKSS